MSSVALSLLVPSGLPVPEIFPFEIRISGGQYPLFVLQALNFTVQVRDEGARAERLSISSFTICRSNHEEVVAHAAALIVAASGTPPGAQFRLCAFHGKTLAAASGPFVLALPAPLPACPPAPALDRPPAPALDRPPAPALDRPLAPALASPPAPALACPLAPALASPPAVALVCPPAPALDRTAHGPMPAGRACRRI